MVSGNFCAVLMLMLCVAYRRTPFQRLSSAWTKDWHAIVELSMDDTKDKLVLKKISTAAKTALTPK